MKSNRRSSLYGAMFLAASAASVIDQPALAEGSGRFKVITGAEYTSGDYGGSESIDEWYVPVTGKYMTDTVVLRLTVPYLQVSAPEGSVFSAGGGGPVVRQGSGSRTTESGLGDIIAGLSYLDVLGTERSGGVALDLTGKIKFGTADEDKGLGTGEHDYTVQGDLVKYFERFAPYASLGYVFRGDPPGYDLDNSAFAVVGGSYRLSDVLTGSVDGYFREASSRAASDQTELTAALNYRLNDKQKLMGYIIRGLDDGSPEWGVGVMISISQ